MNSIPVKLGSLNNFHEKKVNKNFILDIFYYFFNFIQMIKKQKNNEFLSKF